MISKQPGKTVFIYGKDGCPFCVKAVELCKQKNVDFVYRNLSKGDWIIEDLTEMLGQRPTTVPQIFVDEIHIGGFNELNDYI